MQHATHEPSDQYTADFIIDEKRTINDKAVSEYCDILTLSLLRSSYHNAVVSGTKCNGSVVSLHIGQFQHHAAASSVLNPVLRVCNALRCLIYSPYEQYIYI